jgi:hypothetical protein
MKDKYKALLHWSGVFLYPQFRFGSERQNAGKELLIMTKPQLILRKAANNVTAP